MSPEPLHPDDLEALAELVAVRLAELMADRQTPQPAGAALVTSAEVARRFDVRAEWVREHADELGAVRLGDGPRPRLRFDAAMVEEALTACREGKRSQPPDHAQQSRRSNARRARTAAGVPLLPIAGEEGYSARRP